MKKMIRRIITLTLALMVVGSLCATAFATGFTSAAVNVFALEKEAEEINPDAGRIFVEKQFFGITEDQVPSDFQIHVSQSGSTNDISLGEHTSSTIRDDDGNEIGFAWRWEIDNAGVGSYTISESGESLMPKYSVESSGLGNNVTIQAGDFTVKPDKETSCDHKNWPVRIDGDSNVLFAAALTGNEGCVVISRTRLTASQMITVAKAVVGIGGNWKDPVKFFNIADNGNGPYTVAGKELHYEPETGEIILKDESNWSHVATVTYSITAASDADLTVTNTYTRRTADVNITKEVTGNMGDGNKQFTIHVTFSEKIGQGDGYSVSEDGYTAVFDVRHNKTVTIKDVPIGAKITSIEEENAEGYVKSLWVKGDEKTPYELGTAIPEGGVSVVVENRKDVDIDTGIFLDSLPYVLILAVVAAGAVVFLRKRRSRDED